MDQNSKQQVSEKLRKCTSVLITVSENPSVDQLSAALGLALMMEKLKKHTTTVFSGKIPETMAFLKPAKTFESSVDGLRDFIISLDKQKADKLRYKVEDDVVKIFITPYKDAITKNDLQYSQGDFNVDLVVALGVHDRDQLDSAITSHGRILHDATIVTINAGDGADDGSLGSINWGDAEASSLCEMLVSISEALEGGIINEAISTALLTGIVSVTERFKNDKTTPKIMTMAAQLMAAGANQQLIASNLQLSSASSIGQSGGGASIDHDQGGQLKDKQANKQQATASETTNLSKKKGSSRPRSGEKANPQAAPIADENKLPIIPPPPDITPSRHQAYQHSQGDQMLEEGPVIDDDSFNATSAEVRRQQNRTRMNDAAEAIAQGSTRPDSLQQPSNIAPTASVSPPTLPDSDKEVGGQSAKPTADGPSLEEARLAVEQAISSQFTPDNNPIESLGAAPLEQEESEVMSPPSAPPPIVPPKSETPAERVAADDLTLPIAAPESSSKEDAPVSTPVPAPPENQANTFVIPPIEGALSQSVPTAPLPPPPPQPPIAPPPPPPQS